MGFHKIEKVCLLESELGIESKLVSTFFLEPPASFGHRLDNGGTKMGRYSKVLIRGLNEERH
ncbi:hypothetical protein ACO1PF_05905 [Alkalibacterium sp. f15]|uniref:hypothetical protein n=1 Tax=Alkalibacterium sp. f15 TaxID=3414029 RepID=UPI003BF8AC67